MGANIAAFSEGQYNFNLSKRRLFKRRGTCLNKSNFHLLIEIVMNKKC